MASFQYLRDLKEEDIAPDAPKEYTKQEKWANWWDYNLRFVLIGLVVLAFVGYMIWDIISTIRPDTQISVVAPQTLSDLTLDPLRDAVAPFAIDSNGDGDSIIAVYSYFMNFNSAADYETEEAIVQSASEADSASQEATNNTDEDALTAATQNGTYDAYSVMAGQTQLAGDLADSTSNIFILKDPEGFQKHAGVLCYLDGSMPEEDATDWENMVYLLSDCPALGDLPEELDGYFIARRTGYTDDAIESFAKNEPIWQAITEGATPYSERIA